MTESMLLAEELALVAVNPDTGRHAAGGRSRLNACLAGLLVAELVLDGAVAPGERTGQVVATNRKPPGSPTLAAAARVVAEKAPKLKAGLQHMSRGLEAQLGLGTWDLIVAGLVAAGALAPTEGSIRPRNVVADARSRDAVIVRLRSAAAGDGALDLRTALVLNMTGPAKLLEVVAPERGSRRHARRRIDHGLDGTDLEIVGKTVRKLIAEGEAAATGGGGAVAATSG